MKKLLIPLLTVVLLGLAACGRSDALIEQAEAPAQPVQDEAPVAEPVLVTSLEDIVGTWEGIKGGGGSIQIEGDGDWTRICCAGLRRIAEVRFEGKRFFITETASEVGMGEICVPTGIYEIQLLEDGNLKFVAIEDECEKRRNALQGAAGINVEWRPVL